METYAGIDLHSSNSYVGIIDEQGQRHFRTGKFFQASIGRTHFSTQPGAKELSHTTPKDIHPGDAPNQRQYTAKVKPRSHKDEEQYINGNRGTLFHC